MTIREPNLLTPILIAGGEIARIAGVRPSAVSKLEASPLRLPDRSRRVPLSIDRRCSSRRTRGQSLGEPSDGVEPDWGRDGPREDSGGWLSDRSGNRP